MVVALSTVKALAGRAAEGHRGRAVKLRAGDGHHRPRPRWSG